MSYASIVTIISGAPDDRAAVSVACDLVKRQGAAATVVIDAPLMVPASSPFGPGGGLMAPQVWAAIDESRDLMVRELRAMIEEEAQRRGFTLEAQGCGPRVTMAPEAVTAALALRRELPLADLAIIGRSNVRGEGPWTGAFADTLMAGRAPVLIVRDGAAMADAPAAVAWDGSPEAGRAIRAAIPLLQEASKVLILQDPEALDVSVGSAADPQRLVRYLAARGVRNPAVTRLKEGKPGPALLRAAESCGAALLVAGAFGHARLWEALLGGVTQSFLAADGPNILLSH